MSRQGEKYERTVAFVVNIWRDGKDVDQIHLQQEMVLPLSQKTYKVTLKNVEVYIEELCKLDSLITSIRLDRISHVKIYNIK